MPKYDKILWEIIDYLRKEKIKNKKRGKVFKINRSLLRKWIKIWMSLLGIYLQSSRELTKEDRKIGGKENVRVQDKYLRRCMQQLLSYLHLNE